MAADPDDPDGTKMRNAPVAGQVGGQASPNTGTGGGGVNRPAHRSDSGSAEGEDTNDEASRP